MGRLVQLLKGEAGSPRPSAKADARQQLDPGAAVACLEAGGGDTGGQQIEVGRSFLAEQQQQGQQLGQVGPYTRARGNTCEVLIEVAARLQDAVDSAPGSAAAAAAGSATAAAVAAALRGDHEQGGCDPEQQQQQQVVLGLQEHNSSSWEARAAALQQQGGGAGVPRPVPSPSARLLVQAIFEASMATAGVGTAQQQQES